LGQSLKEGETERRGAGRGGVGGKGRVYHREHPYRARSSSSPVLFLRRGERESDGERNAQGEGKGKEKAHGFKSRRKNRKWKRGKVRKGGKGGEKSLR